jgi:hypothetical protein
MLKIEAGKRWEVEETGVTSASNEEDRDEEEGEVHPGERSRAGREGG